MLRTTIDCDSLSLLELGLTDTTTVEISNASVLMRRAARVHEARGTVGAMPDTSSPDAEVK